MNNETNKNSGIPTIDANQANQIIKDLNPDLIVKQMFDSGKIKDNYINDEVNKRAAKEPLPGSYGEMYFNTEPLEVKTSVGMVTIRPMVAYDINIFKAVNSPFYQVIMGDQVPDSNGNLFATDEEYFEMVYQFTHPIKEIYNLLKKGKEAFKDKVLEDVAFKYSPVDCAVLTIAIMKHIMVTQSAKAEFVAPESPDDDKKKQ